jgi:hypothetical protein
MHDPLILLHPHRQVVGPIEEEMVLKRANFHSNHKSSMEAAVPAKKGAMQKWEAVALPDLAVDSGMFAIEMALKLNETDCRQSPRELTQAEEEVSVRALAHRTELAFQDSGSSRRDKEVALEVVEEWNWTEKILESTTFLATKDSRHKKGKTPPVSKLKEKNIRSGVAGGGLDLTQRAKLFMRASD